MTRVFTDPINIGRKFFTLKLPYKAGVDTDLRLETLHDLPDDRPSLTKPVRLVAIRSSDGAISIIKASGRIVDGITLLEAAEGTSLIDLAAGDRLLMELTGGYFSDIHDFLNEIIANGTVGNQGPPGDKGPIGDKGPTGDRGQDGSNSDKTFYYTQASASSTWTITHNLGKYPSVTIIDSANTAVWGDVDYIDGNTVVVSFTASFAGTATLN